MLTGPMALMWGTQPMRKYCALFGATVLLVGGCASVHQEDLASWIDRPVSELDTQPMFLTMQVARTRTEDGTEIRNYVNGKEVISCSGGGSIFAGPVNMATYNQYSSCARNFPTCNNIFQIKSGRVISYTPVGTGGARCFTDERARAGFAGA